MRLIDADTLEREGWSLCRNYQQDKNVMVYETKSIQEIPTAQPYTEAEIQKMQDLEQAELKKAFELGKAEANRWIPCSERLPEKAGLYTVSGGEKVWISEFAILGNIRGGWINSVFNPTIKAWMPLPEPYKRGEEE